MIFSLSSDINNLDMVENIVSTYKDFLNDTSSFVNNKFSKILPSESELSDDKRESLR